MLKVLAFDYGASSGRAIMGHYDGKKIGLREMHRFPNDPVTINCHLYWNIRGLYHEMKQGIANCMKNGDSDIAGIGIDTWGVDYGLLDAGGNLMGNPYHYRDLRTEGMIGLAESRISKYRIYETTGIAFQKFNTLYQIMSMSEQKSPMLEQAQDLLFIPDLLGYFLTGDKTTEYTIASTSQMLSAEKRSWALDMLENLGVPRSILTGIIDPGTVKGTLKKEVSEELNAGKVPVIAVAGHDTASAIMSVPYDDTGSSAYISSGTWSLMGVERKDPVISQETCAMNYSNEGGFNHSVRLLKNIMGLWIYQECKRYWDKKGGMAGFDELEALALGSRPFRCFIDPDGDMFYSPGRMPEKVAEYCRRTGQYVPESKGEIVRCVMESLAMKYRMTLEGLERISGRRLSTINIVGGGSRNSLLDTFTANSTGRLVVAGPVEATAVGNLICQLIALGEISNLDEGREIIKNSFPLGKYEPEDSLEWEEAYQKFRNVLGISATSLK